MLAIAGLTFAYTSCTDYSEDIDKTNSRVDNLETKLADVEKQVASNKAAIEDLQKAKAEAEAAIKALQETVATLETKEDHKKDVDALKSTIEGLKLDVKGLDTRIKAIEDKLPSYATREYVDATFATKKEMAAANEQIGKLDARLVIAEGQLKTLSDKYDSNLKISEIIAKIDAAKAAADAAQATASEALGKVKALVEALGVYAEKGNLAAKIEALEAADKKLDTTKLNISDFDKYFDKALEAACKDGGEVYEKVYKPLHAEVVAVDNKLTALAATVNAQISKLWGVFNTELRSLVFVPSLYVDGIEAVEYTYGNFTAYEFDEPQEAHVFTKGDTTYTLTGANYSYDTANKGVAVNPELEVEYEMNPSSAIVTEGTKLHFITRKAESVSTKAGEAGFDASFSRIANGNLYVNLKADYQAATANSAAASQMIDLFALQANVKNAADKDTTVTSDYARIVAATMSIEGVAFKSSDYKAVKCLANTTLNDHLYAQAEDAISAKATTTVGYKGTLDLKKLVVTHYTSNTITAKGGKTGVYETDFPKNEYGLTYDFDLVDYTVNEDELSDSQFATIKNGVLAPCGVDAQGKANGEVNTSSIDRNPVVRVTVKAGDAIVAVGFIKVKIVPQDYIKADEFAFTATANDCENFVDSTASADMQTKVYVKVDADNETAFDAYYKLQVAADNVAEQYTYNGTEFTSVAADKTVGEVKEGVDADGKSVLVLTLTPKDKNAIYKMSGHSTTIWVRYIFARSTTPETKFEGVYVPIKVTVTKNAAGTVGVKLAAYWFDNQTKAILNVKVPNAEPGQPVPSTWATPINQVWEGNAPKFTVAGNAVENPTYKYYFAPIQPKVGDVQLTVVSNKIYDLYDNTDFTVTKNEDLANAEVTLSADYSKGVYTNTELKAGETVIATIDQATGVVTYANNEVAKKLLNCSPSVPKSAAQLYANIGVVLKAGKTDCNLVAAVASEVNPYYFLRPLNLEAVPGKVYVDGVDAYKPEANLNVFDVFSFTDWRGEAGRFVTPDYSNLWYFKYYNVKNFKVNVADVTTTLNGGTLGETKLSAKTEKIQLFHCTGDIKNPQVVPASGLDITYSSPVTPTWNKEQYDGLSKKFGYIRYQNNGAAVSESFMLRIPVEVTYEWGVISTTVDVTVNPTI